MRGKKTMKEKTVLTRENLTKVAEMVPSSVLGMQPLGPEEIEKLDDKYFALIYKRRGIPTIRKFPVVDAGNVYMSALQWGLSREAIPEAARKIAAFYIYEAANRYMLDMYPFKAEIASQAKSMATAPMTNVIIDDGAIANTLTKKANSRYYIFPEKLSYPIDTEKEVKVASSYFDQWSDNMDVGYRRKYATTLVKRAEEISVEVGPWVKKNASQYRNPAFDAKINARIGLTNDETNKNVWRKIASMAPSLDNEALIEMVSMMDKVAGLDKMYGRILQDPILSVTTETAPKETIEKTACDLTEEELNSVGYDTLKKYYGADFADQFTRDRNMTYKALDNEHKSVIKSMAQGLIS